VLYTASPTRRVIALDAGTGRELWKWNPRSERRHPEAPGNAVWCSGKMKPAVNGGSSRVLAIIFYALDPKSGQTIRSFGENGSIHLGTGLDVEGTPGVGLNTPGVTYKDLLIIGGLGGPARYAPSMSELVRGAGYSI